MVEFMGLGIVEATVVLADRTVTTGCVSSTGRDVGIEVRKSLLHGKLARDAAKGGDALMCERGEAG